jgi:arsenical pump membrane protein
MLTHAIVAAANQAWPAFVLVAGLLLIGSVAAEDGLFEATGARLARSRLGAHGLLVALLGLVAVVTAVLNLDTAVVFLTPVLVHAARNRGLVERPFLYGSVFMANSASLLLPGSNLTNLLVLRSRPQDGGSFAAHMLPAWLAACAITAGFVTVVLRPREADLRAAPEPHPLRLRLGAAATLAAALLVVLLPNPALPVLAVGIVVAALRRLRPRIDARLLAFLFAVTVILGTLARLWHWPAKLLAASGVWEAAATGAVASLVLNNLPATVLFSARTPSHPDALLLGLDLGPNLAVSGSLAAVLWVQAARGVGARPSLATYTRLGIVLVPLTLAAAVGVLLLPRPSALDGLGIARRQLHPLVGDVHQLLEHEERLREHEADPPREKACNDSHGDVRGEVAQRRRMVEVAEGKPGVIAVAVDPELVEKQRTGSGRGSGRGARRRSREDHRKAETLSDPEPGTAEGEQQGEDPAVRDGRRDEQALRNRDGPENLPHRVHPRISNALGPERK